MKKILYSALFLLLSLSTSAHATQFSASGYFLATGQFADKLSLSSTDDSKSTFKVYERIEISLDLLNSTDIGDIGGQLKFRIPEAGRGHFGGDYLANPDIVSPQLRSAYIFFPLASTPISAKLGLQDFALPAYLGSSSNPAFDDVAAGLVLSSSLGMMSPTFAWFVLEYPDTAGKEVSNFFSLSVPLAISNSITLNPWFALDEYNNDTMYAGVTSNISHNKLNTGLDLLFAQEGSNSSSIIDFYASYEFASFTPSFIAWYSTGRTYDNAGISFSSTGSWGSFYGSNNMMFDNAYGLQDLFYTSTNSSTNALASPFGTLGIGFALADINITEKSSFAANVLYISETNDDNKVDSALETSANIFYSMVNNLDFILEASYYMPMPEVSKFETNGLSIGGSVKYSF